MIEKSRFPRRSDVSIDAPVCVVARSSLFIKAVVAAPEMNVVKVDLAQNTFTLLYRVQ